MKNKLFVSLVKGGLGTRLLYAITAVVAVGASVHASPIRFDNPAHDEAGHFHWAVPGGDNTNWLDFTQDPNAQPGEPWGNTCLRNVYLSVPACSLIGTDGPGTVRVEEDGFWLVPLEFGDLVPSGAPATNEGCVYFEGYETPIPEGVPVYMGIHFDIGAGVQYGWIGFIRTVEQVEAFAWGYETVPGVSVPAGAPEPGTLALLAFGALFRRRR